MHSQCLSCEFCGQLFACEDSHVLIEGSYRGRSYKSNKSCIQYMLNQFLWNTEYVFISLDKHWILLVAMNGGLLKCRPGSSGHLFFIYLFFVFFFVEFNNFLCCSLCLHELLGMSIGHYTGLGQGILLELNPNILVRDEERM